MGGILKNGLTLLGLGIIAALGYYLWVIQSDEATSLDSNTEIGEARLASEQFLREIETMKGLQLSKALFSDQRFRSFVDFTLPVPEQPVGRTNPFAPVE